MTDKHAKGFSKYEYKPKNVQSRLTNMIVYDFETCNTDRDNPYSICIQKLSKISDKFNRDITQRESERCRNDCIVFKGTNCLNDMLDSVLEFTGEAKRVNNKFVKYNLYLIAHNGSGFDNSVVYK